jgi:hypothetical protein
VLRWRGADGLLGLDEESGHRQAARPTVELAVLDIEPGRATQLSSDKQGRKQTCE